MPHVFICTSRIFINRNFLSSINRISQRQAHQNNRFIVEKSLLLEFSTLVGTFFQSDCKVHNFGSQIPNLIMISIFITQWTSLLVFQIFLAASSGRKFSNKNALVFFELCKSGLYSIFIGVIVWKILFISKQEFSSSAILSDKGLIIKVSNIKNMAQFLTHSSQFFAFLDSMVSVLPLIASMYNKKISLRRLKVILIVANFWHYLLWDKIGYFSKNLNVKIGVRKKILSKICQKILISILQ